eukprot:CAMPEP_0119277366 /NCGR_PEP_ID=MMETSP1329-20130426/16964_1 /TAXON_ID=114041 /ORGANISM="Genus nov. species nov., Strain RCC1024" /LENGTH=201 /DNA_ID=CAMNT_0007277831 /DNA_START=91 /DNA_END=692 /DNA_ORIENTATION=+
MRAWALVAACGAFLAAAQQCPAVDPAWEEDQDIRPEDISCIADEDDDCSPEPCLVGVEWDALRQVKGLNDVEDRDREIVVEMNDWPTSAIQTHLVTILVGEMLGYRVRVLHRTDPTFSLQRLASGATTLAPEIWGHASTKLADYQMYVRAEKPCVLSKFSGVTADQKLYAPAYVASSICESYSAVKTNPKDVRDTVAPPDG